MKISGSTIQGYKIAPSNFTLDVPEGSTLKFDASQSTLTVSTRDGSVLVAIKQVAWYSTEGVTLSWIKGEA